MASKPNPHLCAECETSREQYILALEAEAITGTRGTCKNKHSTKTACATIGTGVGLRKGETTSPKVKVCCPCSNKYQICQKCGGPLKVTAGAA